MVDELENLFFKLKLSFLIFLQLTQKRKNYLLFHNSYKLFNELNNVLNLIEGKHFKVKELKNKLLEIESKLTKFADDMYLVIKTELRYILYPEFSIKKEASKIGKNYMNNFFDWIENSERYSNDDLYKIVQKELLELDDVRGYLWEAHLMLLK